MTSAPCEHVAAPRVAEAPVVVRVPRGVVRRDRREPSDNVLLICEIIAYHVRDGLLRDGRIDPALLRPICRLGGTGFARLGEIINIARPRIARS